MDTCSYICIPKAIKRDILNQQDWKGQEIDTQSKHHVLNRSSSEEKTYRKYFNWKLKIYEFFIQTFSRTSNDFDLKKNLDRTSENRPFLRSNIQKKMQDISVPVRNQSSNLLRIELIIEKIQVSTWTDRSRTADLKNAPGNLSMLILFV